MCVGISDLRSLHVRWVCDSPQESLWCSACACLPRESGWCSACTCLQSSLSWPVALCGQPVPAQPLGTFAVILYPHLTLPELACSNSPSSSPGALCCHLWISIGISFVQHASCALMGSLGGQELLWREVGTFVGLARHCLRFLYLDILQCRLCLFCVVCISSLDAL